jgi:short-subunit dehydrogenase involved in D-alanine esterification of teichoic acids
MACLVFLYSKDKKKSKMNLENNTVLITGGSSGIGLALAKEYLSHNSKVIICARDLEKLKEVQKELPDIKIIRCDITDQNMIETLKQECMEINILINSAGIQYNYDFTDNKNHSQLIEDEINTNFLAQLKIIDQFLPLLMNKNSAIVNISSALAFVPKKSAPVYCATKAAMHIFTKSLRYQLQGSCVKVFEIIPPLVDTNMTKGRGVGKISPERLAKEALKNIELDNYEIKIGKSKILLLLDRFLPSVAEKIVKNG